jgi:nitroreductase
MQVSHAIRERRSIRAFLPDEVAPDTIRQILDLVKWSPSWANTQDWKVYVLTGDTLERLKEASAILGEEGLAAQPDLPMPPREWPEYLAERMVSRRLAAEAGDAAASDERRNVWRFYGAPALVLFAVDERLEPAYACFDAGLITQTFCLAAEDRGFNTCIMAVAVRYADVLHELIPEAEAERFVIGVALGFADHSALVNRGERSRVETGDIAVFLDGQA